MTALVQVVEQTRGHGIGASMAAAVLGCQGGTDGILQSEKIIFDGREIGSGGHRRQR